MNTHSREANINLNEILDKLCERLEDGCPDFTNEGHISILINVLREHNWTDPSIRVFVRNLWLQAEQDKREKKYAKNGENR